MDLNVYNINKPFEYFIYIGLPVNLYKNVIKKNYDLVYKTISNRFSCNIYIYLNKKLLIENIGILYFINIVNLDMILILY